MSSKSKPSKAWKTSSRRTINSKTIGDPTITFSSGLEARKRFTFHCSRAGKKEVVKIRKRKLGTAFFDAFHLGEIAKTWKAKSNYMWLACDDHSAINWGGKTRTKILMWTIKIVWIKHSLFLLVSYRHCYAIYVNVCNSYNAQ